jgi:DNA-binding LytR/AlgR family response regulator
MFKYSIIGIDDKSALNLISQLSSSLKFEFVGSTENPQELLDIILESTPNLIFINVDNYTPNSYLHFTSTVNDLYRSFPNKPSIVALASTDKQAYDCIKNGFFDYLIHPIDEIQLRKLEYKLRTSTSVIEENPEKLCLQTYTDYQFIEIKDIIFLKADNNTTKVYLRDNTQVIAYKTLKYFEAILPKKFKRIHQSFIINQNYISRIHLGRSECHLKTLKMRLPFSKSYKKVMANLASTLSANAVS